MGTVKPAFIKRTAEELLEQYKDLFTEDFEHNKELVQKILKLESKEVRNRIAGYITRKINQERRRQKKNT